MIVALVVFGGMLPSCLVFSVFGMVVHHVTWQINFALLIGGYILFVFGSLLGALVGYVSLLAEKYYFLENSDSIDKIKS